MKRFLKLLMGTTLSSFAIAMVINCNLGAFPITACNLAISNWLNIPLGLAGFLTELIMLSYATAKGEGLGWTAIANATYGSFMIDIFHRMIPYNTLFVFGVLLLPIAWAIMGSAGWGETGSNVLMRALVKSTKKSLGFIRGCEEVVTLIIGFMGARNYVTWFSIVLSLGMGPLLQFVYKLIGYNPITIKQEYIIKIKK